ncbi:interferon-induced very large GTPase 1-like [Pelobates fuscus]|uniref:interferon-induced very large GTPase 1-like n=1 Tax=Pelobates fuscus TaxID=191477 RepID=UPI002FE480EA
MLSELKMEIHRTSKLRLKDILDVGCESVKNVDLQSLEDVPWHFLQKLMALNVMARDTQFDQKNVNNEGDENGDQDPYSDFLPITETNTASIHPLDVLCAVLHCSDHFLQQEIVTKMSMCQFAVPLLLPTGDGSNCTFMLWAMRDIVKRWGTQSSEGSTGFVEENLVTIKMPTFSFVRLGEFHFSKSKILNSILSPAHNAHEFFVHRDMESANVPRKISDALVEISWYFPKQNDNIFPGPIAVTNLRGDLKSNLKQFRLLTSISSAVFIFTEKITEREFNMLADLGGTDTSYYFIIDNAPNKEDKRKTAKYLNQLFPILKLDKSHVLVKSSQSNAAKLSLRLQNIIANLTNNPEKITDLENMALRAAEFKIHIDESSEECQKAKKHALEITAGIKDVTQWKKETMRLQGNLWKKISRVEKEMCRRKYQGVKDSESYQSELKEKLLNYRREQSQYKMTDSLIKFSSAITTLSQVEKNYFVKWMKCYLDAIGRDNLAKLRAQYKNNLKNMSPNEVKELNQQTSESSLGIEHFLRELGQFYESECAILKEGDSKTDQRQFSHLPGIAADLLLDGFPLELIDGEASNIPLRWITDVLTELDTKTGGQCRMRVITVLGVQSTGKSTLLNTMFGLQFPVASGQCTRGAFMTLINVKEDFHEDLGCDFILVIDTEGLKNSVSISDDQNYENDNELATLAVGLSDIAIINMAMESTAEMKDILQIVVHAFIRMTKAGKKPNCQFAHQNVSDVSAPDNTLIERIKLMEELNKMTEKAAKMESNRAKSFSDIIEYNLEEHSWYIPSLWHGVPPMASVNSGYSENIFKFKQYLFDFMKKNKSNKMSQPQDIATFVKWLNNLWKEVKHEKFLFSFRNILVAEAYDNLTKKYCELEWDFRKEIQKWMNETENLIKNLPIDDLDNQLATNIKPEMGELLDREEQKMHDLLETYFKNGCENPTLTQQYESQYLFGIKGLRMNIETSLSQKCLEVIQIQKGKQEIQLIKSMYINIIEVKVNILLENCKKKHGLSPKEAIQECEAIFDEIMTEFQFHTLVRHNVEQEMLKQLKTEMVNKGSSIRQRLDHIINLKDEADLFHISAEHIDYDWLTLKEFSEFEQINYKNEANDFAASLIDSCHYFVTQKVITKEDYNEIYCRDLLNMINERLTPSAAEKLCTKTLFELDLKLHILGKAVVQFQKMHNDFIQENDPKHMLINLKARYSSCFNNILQQQNASKDCAKHFCESCLKPAIIEYINKNLGGEMVDDMLDSDDSSKYKSRSIFQYHVLKELLEKNDFKLYLEYIHRYESFARILISENISIKYENFTHFEKIIAKIVSSIYKKIRKALKNPTALECSNLEEFLGHVCKELNKELVISPNDVKTTLFKNEDCKNVLQFSNDIDEFLAKMEGQIITDLKDLNTDAFLSNPTQNAEEVLFKRVVGCGKQCPFCKVPCEAGGDDHDTHRASVHRPKGLARHKWVGRNVLCNATCSADIITKKKFKNSETKGEFRFYSDYQKIYPDWEIEHETSSAAYWKFVFKEFNSQFAEEYGAKPAHILEEWKNITREEALESLKEMYKANDFASSLIDSCHDFVTQKVIIREDYNEIYCRDLLKLVNEKLTSSAAEKLCTKPLFELDLKLHILSKAAVQFEKMHNDFIQENDPKHILGNLKLHYFSCFNNILQQQNASKDCAKRFCESCLKPAIIEYINKNLSGEMVDDMLDSDDSSKYKSRSIFQYHVLKELLEKNDFKLYLEYIHRYESFARKWISENISIKYENFTHLEKIIAKIVSSIYKKIRKALKNPTALECSNLEEFLGQVCKELNKELVISPNDIKTTIFKNENCSNVPQFSNDIDEFLKETKGQIITDLKDLNTESFLSNPSLNAEEVLFKRVVGCGKQCPFCKVPCEAGGGDHDTHRASVHRPKGLARHRWVVRNILCNATCSADIITKKKFKNSETKGEFRFYSDYQKIYPDWEIEHETSSAAYWKFVFKEFNSQFAEDYGSKPAHILEEWKNITREEALESLKEMYKIE